MNAQETVRVAFCPHCSNVAPQRLLCAYTFEETRPYDKSFDFGPGEGPTHRYFLSCCSTCKDALLYISTYDPCPPEEFDKGAVVYPHGVTLDSSVPENVRTAYDEALRIQHNAPHAYSLMLRRALEAICDDKGVKSGSLKFKLDQLAAQGQLPPVLAEMTWILRTLGNAGAHDTSARISVYTTWALDSFFRAVIEYVYVAPSKLAHFKKQLEEGASREDPSSTGLSSS
jgi:hypothetical protein